MKKERIKSTVILLAITLFAAALRLPYLESYPPALYSDEVSQGYNAYSLLKTSRDEYGILLPISFRSFGDWKPPLSTYVMLPTIWLFGLNSYGIRLPSALLGTLTVYFSFYLVKELLKYAKSKHGFLVQHADTISLLTALLLAISPWHIQQSRSAMLIAVELFCLVVALLAFFKGLRIKRWWLVSSLFWILGIYSYYGMRLIVPLFVLFLFIEFREKIISSQKFYRPVLLAIILLLPFVMSYLQQPDVLFGRAKSVSIFHDKGVSLLVWDLIAQDGPQMPTKLAQFLHNKPYYYVVDIVRRFGQHFDARFLLLEGDQQLPFQLPGMGILYLFDSIWMLIGAAWLLRNAPKLFWFLSFWIFVSVLPASLTFVTPAANRTFTMVLPLMFFAAVGVIISLVRLQTWRRVGLLITILALYILSFAHFTYLYTRILPKEHADIWYYGYQELYAYLKKQDQDFDTIYVSGNLSVPYIYYLFYNQVDPALAQNSIRHNFNDDEYGFEHVDSVGKYEFLRYFSWEKDKSRLLTPALLVTKSDEIVGKEARQVQTIRYPNERGAFTIYVIADEL